MGHFNSSDGDAAPSGLDVAALRSDLLDSTDTVHLNQAGAALMSRSVYAAIEARLMAECRTGPMEIAPSAAVVLDDMRHEAAQLLRADATEIAFAGSGTAAWGQAFAALPPWRVEDRILVCRQEWGGNVATARLAARKTGARIEVMPVADDGRVDVAALERIIDDRVRLLCLTWLPSNGGLVNNAAEVGALAKAAGIPYVIDAGQALGQIPIDVGTLQCDVLTAAGRKHVRGPRGTGLLYVRKGFLGALSPAFLDARLEPDSRNAIPFEDARCFEQNEVSPALIAGFTEALRRTRTLGVERIWSHVTGLAEELRGNLERLPGVTVQDAGPHLSGIVAFTIDGVPAGDARRRLLESHIEVGISGLAYTPFDMQARHLSDVLRASVSCINAAADLERLISAVAGIATRPPFVAAPATAT
jgi:selenocysteine lyase/cysteine desulfurase